MSPADGGSRDNGGGPKSTEGRLPGISKESDSDDSSSVNMQRFGEDKQMKSKNGVFSCVSLTPPCSPSTSDQNDINVREKDEKYATDDVTQKLGELNIRGTDDSHSDVESESGVSSDEEVSTSESDSEDSESTLPSRAPPIFKKRGPNGVFQQFGSSLEEAKYSKTNQQINLCTTKTGTSEDILETSGQILEEGQIRGFLHTFSGELPVLVPDDLTCLSSSSPEHVTTSDYGSLPGSPYETSASMASPASASGGRIMLSSQTPDGRAQSVDPIGTDLSHAPTLSMTKLGIMRNIIMGKPENKKFLLLNENGNSQLTICLAQMAHKDEPYDEHFICAMIDFCSERKAELLWYRNDKGETPLLIACGLHSHSIIARHLTQVLIRLGHHFQERYDGTDGNSLLHAMALRDERCYPCMREILEVHSQQPIPGLDINTLNANGLSPLHLAVVNETPSINMILLLIRHGAKPCQPTANADYNGNAIHLALKLSKSPAHIIEALLSQVHTHCANLLRTVSAGNLTPIQMAVKREDLGVAELTRLIQTLLRWGADGTYSLP